MACVGISGCGIRRGVELAFFERNLQTQAIYHNGFCVLPGVRDEDENSGSRIDGNLSLEGKRPPENFGLLYNIAMNSEVQVAKMQERRSARFWTAFILALMAIDLLVAVFAIVFAVGDPSFQPVPSYGESGVDWETTKKLQAESDALGWKASVERSLERDAICVSLSDPQGEPVTGAIGNLQAYHFTRAGDAVTVPAIESETQPGLYIATTDVSKDGRWQVTVRLTRGEKESFRWDHDVEWYR